MKEENHFEDFDRFVAHARSREEKDKESHRKIEKFMILESVFGMLNELSSEQLEIFEEAMKRRPIFKTKNSGPYGRLA